MKKLLIVSILFIVIGLGVNGFAADKTSSKVMTHEAGMTHEKGMMPHGMMMGSGNMMMGGIDAYKNTDWYKALTPEKQSAAAKLIDQGQKDITALKLDLTAKKAELNALMFNDKTQKPDIDKQVELINKLHSELFSKQTNMSIELKNQGAPYAIYNSIMGGGMGCGGMMNGMGGGMMNGGGCMNGMMGGKGGMGGMMKKK